MAANPRVLWLGLTAAVAVVAVIVLRSGSDTPAASTTRRPSAAAQAAAAAPDVAPPAVKLEALKASREAPRDGARDPFRFRAVAAPPPQRIAGVPDDQVDAPPPPRMPTGPPPPPPITLKFIGLVEKADGTRIAVLSDGQRPISGTEGEEIEGRYKILKIGTESIEIAYLDGRGRQTIRLTGQ